MTFTGSKASAVSFPLGGIGTGSIGLAANGRLIDWEIFNKPNKGGLNGFTSFVVKAEANGAIIDARVLEGDPPPPYTGSGRGFGFGLERESMAGLPHFRDTVFEATFPIATITFMDDSFPGKVRLTAFNPLIPLEDKDSSLPAAFFEIEIENTSEQRVEYTVCLNAQNPSPPGRCVNRYVESGRVKLLVLSPHGLDERDVAYGQLAVATDAENVSCQEYWYRGSWFDNLQVFWRDFTTPGKLKERRYPEPQLGVRDHGSLAAHVQLNPGERGKVRFLIAWYYPNCRNYWNPESDKPRTWRNYYATLFSSVEEVLLYCFEKWDWLYSKTREFTDLLFASTLPSYVVDAVSSNLAVLKSPTVLRLEGGELYGFEGCSQDSGCCEGCCAHVWRYSIAPLYLFPNLDKSMWELHLNYSVDADGRMSFRLMLPLGRKWLFPHAAVDGQCGCLLRIYALWRSTGDDEWLRDVWPVVKKMVEYAWAEANVDAWDRDRDGVLEGRQHNTFDLELFGPNAWLTGWYLCALKAASEIAKHVGDQTFGIYEELFKKGKKWVEENLFNGEFFVQSIDLKNRRLLESFSQDDPGVVEAYWDEELGELKYQLGGGCFIAQVEAQFFANLFKLGELLDESKVISTLSSIYRYNFVETRRYFNPCRIYAVDGEKGVVNCTWPKGRRPAIPIPYAEEVWTGLEYIVAAHMVTEGMVEQGLEIVKAVRDRYDGVKRNPWSEIECGSNYARSLSSYSLLIALSGFDWDGRNGSLTFNPKISGNGEFSTFWCCNTAWGFFRSTSDFSELSVRHGRLNLKTLHFNIPSSRTIKSVQVNGKRVEYTIEGFSVKFPEELSLREGDVLRLEH